MNREILFRGKRIDNGLSSALRHQIPGRTFAGHGTEGREKMPEYIDTSINPADYIEVWEAEDAEHGKQLVMAVDDLKCLPIADVRPVKHGKWIVKQDKDGKTYGVCSGGGYKQYAGHLKYCPECGGKMDE